MRILCLTECRKILKNRGTRELVVNRKKIIHRLNRKNKNCSLESDIGIEIGSAKVIH